VAEDLYSKTRKRIESWHKELQPKLDDLGEYTESAGYRRPKLRKAVFTKVKAMIFTIQSIESIFRNDILPDVENNRRDNPRRGNYKARQPIEQSFKEVIGGLTNVRDLISGLVSGRSISGNKRQPAGTVKSWVEFVETHARNAKQRALEGIKFAEDNAAAFKKAHSLVNPDDLGEGPVGTSPSVRAKEKRDDAYLAAQQAHKTPLTQSTSDGTMEEPLDFIKLPPALIGTRPSKWGPGERSLYVYWLSGQPADQLEQLERDLEDFHDEAQFSLPQRYEQDEVDMWVEDADFVDQHILPEVYESVVKDLRKFLSIRFPLESRERPPEALYTPIGDFTPDQTEKTREWLSLKSWEELDELAGNIDELLNVIQQTDLGYRKVMAEFSQDELDRLESGLEIVRDAMKSASSHNVPGQVSFDFDAPAATAGTPVTKPQSVPAPVPAPPVDPSAPDPYFAGRPFVELVMKDRMKTTEIIGGEAIKDAFHGFLKDYGSDTKGRQELAKALSSLKYQIEYFSPDWKKGEKYLKSLENTCKQLDDMEAALPAPQFSGNDAGSRIRAAFDRITQQGVIKAAARAVKSHKEKQRIEPPESFSAAATTPSHADWKTMQEALSQAVERMKKGRKPETWRKARFRFEFLIDRIREAIRRYGASDVTGPFARQRADIEELASALVTRDTKPIPGTKGYIRVAEDLHVKISYLIHDARNLVDDAISKGGGTIPPDPVQAPAYTSRSTNLIDKREFESRYPPNDAWRGKKAQAWADGVVKRLGGL